MNNKTGFINIHLMGGLCNQIFQIVVGYALSLKYNKQLVKIYFWLKTNK